MVRVRGGGDRAVDAVAVGDPSLHRAADVLHPSVLVPVDRRRSRGDPDPDGADRGARRAAGVRRARMGAAEALARGGRAAARGGLARDPRVPGRDGVLRRDAIAAVPRVLPAARQYCRADGWTLPIA